jgi:hypothetical protein
MPNNAQSDTPRIAQNNFPIHTENYLPFPIFMCDIITSFITRCVDRAGTGKSGPQTDRMTNEIAIAPAPDFQPASKSGPLLYHIKEVGLNRSAVCSKTASGD